MCLEQVQLLVEMVKITFETCEKYQLLWIVHLQPRLTKGYSRLLFT